MTNSQAKSELMQIYGMLSEEKKQAIDVLMAQADGEYKSNKELLCDSCYRKIAGCQAKFHNPHPVDHCIEYKPIETQADGEYILKKDVMCCIGQTSLHWELARKLRGLPSVAIPNKVGHWEVMYEPKNMAVCSECGKCAYLYNGRTSAWCPHCGNYKGERYDERRSHKNMEICERPSNI